MNTTMLESKPDLELNLSVRAFRPLGDLMEAGLSHQTIEHLIEAAIPIQTRAIVVDFGAAKYVSTAVIMDLLALSRRLAIYPCFLALLIENHELRDSLTDGGFPRLFVIAATRLELAEKLERLTADPPPGSEEALLTEDDLAAARANPVSLLDILREGERSPS